jgi:hypothetical protein
MRDKQLRVEQLEDRRMLATFMVTNLNDFGPGSLRAAIAQANYQSPGADEIVFSSVSGTINLTIGELEIVDSVSIEGPGRDVLAISGNNQSRIFNINSSSSDVVISGLTLTNGLAEKDAGGAIRSVTNGNVSIINSAITGNTATSGVDSNYYYYGGEGGAVSVTFGSLTITNSELRDNVARYGGAIKILGAELTISQSVISGNQAERAAGIYTSQGNSQIWDSIISDNDSVYGASGIENNFGALTLNGVSISGNGYGIEAYEAEVTITNSTVSGNSHEGLLISQSHLTIANSTITGNSLGVSSFSSESHVLTLLNTILAGNGWLSGEPDLSTSGSSPTTINSNYSLIGDTSNLMPAQLAQINAGTGNLLNVDPMLGPLADNGGPTLTHALLAGSPARNAGDPTFTSPPAFDQRGSGFARVSGGRIDMGAYEEQTVVAPPDSADFDVDGDVDGRDFLAWQRGFGIAAPHAVKLDGDADDDTDVDGNDLAIWQDQYGDPEDLVALSDDTTESPASAWVSLIQNSTTGNDSDSSWSTDEELVFSQASFDAAFADFAPTVGLVASFGDFIAEREFRFSGDLENLLNEPL